MTKAKPCPCGAARWDPKIKAYVQTGYHATKAGIVRSDGQPEGRPTVPKQVMADATTTDPKLVVLADLRELEDDCEKNKPREYGDDSWTAWAADVARRAQAELMSASQPSAPVDRQAVRHYLTCHQCEKKVSTLFTPEPTKTPDGGLIVRAWIECPECIEKDVAESEAEVTALHAERDRLIERVKILEAEKDLEVRLAFAAGFPAMSALMMPVWKCQTCGCLWRDNLDESVSLLDAEQKSCATCEKSTLNACAIHWIPINVALLSASQPSAPALFWECGCGSVNGVNLSECGRCKRHRSETKFAPQPSAESMDDWRPTAAHINALPEPVRSFIHQLETHVVDPAGDVAQLVLGKDTIRQLEAALAESEAEVTALHAERDRLKGELDAANQHVKIADNCNNALAYDKHELQDDLAAAEAEAARLRAALEKIVNEEPQTRGCVEDFANAYQASCSIAKAALDSSGTVPERL